MAANVAVASAAAASRPGPIGPGLGLAKIGLSRKDLRRSFFRGMLAAGENDEKLPFEIVNEKKGAHKLRLNVKRYQITVESDRGGQTKFSDLEMDVVVTIHHRKTGKQIYRDKVQCRTHKLDGDLYAMSEDVRRDVLRKQINKCAREIATRLATNAK